MTLKRDVKGLQDRAANLPGEWSIAAELRKYYRPDLWPEDVLKRQRDNVIALAKSIDPTVATYEQAAAVIHADRERQEKAQGPVV